MYGQLRCEGVTQLSSTIGLIAAGIVADAAAAVVPATEVEPGRTEYCVRVIK